MGDEPGRAERHDCRVDIRQQKQEMTKCKQPSFTGLNAD
jgi:hypothetical protein